MKTRVNIMSAIIKLLIVCNKLLCLLNHLYDLGARHLDKERALKVELI